MKKIIIAAFVALLAVVSCQKSETVKNQENSIDFSTYFGRAITKSDLNQSFNVTAFLAEDGTTQFFPSSTYKYSSGSYSTDPKRYWPVEKNLDFYAVSPVSYKDYDSTSVDITASKLVSLSKLDGSVDFVADSVDNAENGKTVALAFGHKLTKIAFKVKGFDNSKKYIVDSISLEALSTAKYNLESKAWQDTSARYNYVFLDSEVTIAKDTTTAVTIPDVKYLIPMQAETIALTVGYKIYEGVNIIEDNTGENAVTVDLPTTDVWGINKSVVYTLTLNLVSSSEITFSATVDNWNTDTDKNVDIK